MKPKYRAWNKQTESFIDYGDLVLDLQSSKVYAGDMGLMDTIIDVTDQIILMQSTGLKDKNGVEIFEGDIVKAEITLGHTDTGVVKFERGEFKVDDKAEDILSFGFYYQYEVIGNIWENPELLEEKNEQNRN
ncbi:YopX family protein [Enterococcus sp.]|uniref:YopX family protein n=1 Tax=Enterococcus sp. TaxID=35783 RepID=UPI002FC78447